eukprot:366330-Chlamydomonas_euryale.AAC.5
MVRSKLYPGDQQKPTEEPKGPPNRFLAIRNNGQSEGRWERRAPSELGPKVADAMPTPTSKAECGMIRHYACPGGRGDAWHSMQGMSWHRKACEAMLPERSSSLKGHARFSKRA